MASRSSCSRSYNSTVAPLARQPSILMAGASAGMMTVAATSSIRPACETARAWLPEE